MRTFACLFGAPLVLAGVACGGGSSATSNMSDELQRDLAAAASASLQLASETQGFKPMRFVSAIEQSEKAIPIKRRPTPRPVAHNHTASDGAQEKAPDPVPQVAVASPQTPEPEQPAPSSDAPSVPTVAPRPAPIPVDYPSAGTRGQNGPGAGAGPDIGTIIGVVLRGGGVGDDHCIPRGRPRGRGIPGVRLPIQGVPVWSTPPIVPRWR